nr:hypothetical protein [Tanacetum cinerariifolium]
MDDLETDNESVDTPLVSPFLDSDDDSNDGEVLNELDEYGNAVKLCRKKDLEIKNSQFQSFKSLSELIQERQLHNSLGERPVIMEYLVKISKKARILELKRRHLKITVLTSYTPYPSRRIRRFIESMLNHDSSIIISSKIDFLSNEFASELTLLKSIPPGIDETDCYPDEETHFIERLLYDNSSPRPPKEFVSDNSDTEIESFSPSPILVEDSDSLMEEIDFSFTPDYPMLPGIEDDDYDSERDIIILKDLLSNKTLSLPENKSFHFDILSSSCPPTKPPDGNTGILNVKMMGDIFEQKFPMPGLRITLVLNQKKSPDHLSHMGHEAFQLSTNCPMMIHGKNTPILDYSRKREDSCQRILYSSLHFLGFILGIMYPNL